MACITLTRVTLPRTFATLPTPGWEVAYEGQLVATYAEERNGWLHQIGSSRLDASLGRYIGAWGAAKTYPTLDDLRAASRARRIPGMIAWRLRVEHVLVEDEERALRRCAHRT